MPVEIREYEGGVELDVRVVPRASKSRVIGEHGGALKVALAAPPVDGAANEALIELFARELSVAKGAVRIVRGERSRSKRVRIEGARSETIRTLLPG